MKTFAEDIGFTFEDMKPTHPDLTQEEFERVMEQNHDKLVTVMIEAGWEVIDELFPIVEQQNAESEIQDEILNNSPEERDEVD